MAYNSSDPNERRKVLEAMQRNLNSMIMMCDDAQDLIALASIMAVTSRHLLVQHVGKTGAVFALKKVIEEIK